MNNPAIRWHVERAALPPENPDDPFGSSVARAVRVKLHELIREVHDSLPDCRGLSTVEGRNNKDDALAFLLAADEALERAEVTCTRETT